MKNVLYVIVALLSICVGILFYQVNSLKSSGNISLTEKNDVPDNKTTVIASPTDLKLPDAKIAFINIDTLNEKYLFISDYVKVLKNKKNSIEAQLQSLTQKFQQDYEAAQQSAQAGIMPPSEMDAKRKELERQQRDIENKQIQMDNLVVEMQEKNEQLQQEVKNFLKTYNNDKYDYILAYTNNVPSILLANPKLEITNQVLQSLNEDYLNKKNAKTKK